MSTYRVDMAFYVEAETDEGARLVVENGISAQLAADYDWVDTSLISPTNSHKGD